MSRDTEFREGADEYGIGAGLVVKLTGITVGAVVLAAFIFLWFFCRIDVSQSEFVPLLKKTGKNMENDMVMAPSPEFKGPQIEILKEGRHWRNPYVWWWPKPIPATVIDRSEVGILVRQYGKPLPEGEVITRADDEKGIQADPLLPGRYYVNTWAYRVDKHEMVKIEPGFMGVVTLLVGKFSEDPNVFVVKEGERGTQPYLLPPGTHPSYSNPYVHLVTTIDVRSQKFEMMGAYSVTFPSQDGFDISVEGTVEWAPDLKKLPELFVKYVDEKDMRESGGINNIQRKLILPQARSYFRMVGGQHRAVDYITGSTRIKVQAEVERRLKDYCAEQGVIIRAFVIRATDPPRRIREQYVRRETAAREIDRYRKEIETEIGAIVLDEKPKVDKDGKPVLDKAGKPVMEMAPSMDEKGRPVREGGRLAKVIEERRKDREAKFGQIRAEIAEEVRAAEQYAKVELTKGERKVEVTKITFEAAKDRAGKIVAEGEAEAAVTVLKNKAEAAAVEAKVSAFGTGARYAENQLIQKIAPGIKHILSNTEGPFARLFERFSALGKQAPEAGK